MPHSDRFAVLIDRDQKNNPLLKRSNCSSSPGLLVHRLLPSKNLVSTKDIHQYCSPAESAWRRADRAQTSPLPTHLIKDNPCNPSLSYRQLQDFILWHLPPHYFENAKATTQVSLITLDDGHTHNHLHFTFQRCKPSLPPTQPHIAHLCQWAALAEIILLMWARIHSGHTGDQQPNLQRFLS